MEQEKVGKFIKKIRKKNNLTQKQLADKYNVTYQAVSKWENGKNMPDISLIKKMSEDFNISIEEIFEGKIKKSKKIKNNILIIISFSIIVIILILLLKYNDNNNDFNFNTLSTTCNNFTISGNISYNSKKSAIYISNIEYCGEENKEIYNKIECILYESHNDIERKISSYSYNKPITLNDFLKTLTFTVDNYNQTCNNYTKDTLFLSIHATDIQGKITTFKIPLSLDETCTNN